jgi:hypothetical protein
MSHAADRVLIKVGEAAGMLDCSTSHVLDLVRARRLQIIDISTGSTPDVPKRRGCRGKPRSKYWRLGLADVEAFIRDGLGYIQATEAVPVTITMHRSPVPAMKPGERYRFR